jgi:hypothetical protein
LQSIDDPTWGPVGPSIPRSRRWRQTWSDRSRNFFSCRPVSFRTVLYLCVPLSILQSAFAYMNGEDRGRISPPCLPQCPAAWGTGRHDTRRQAWTRLCRGHRKTATLPVPTADSTKPRTRIGLGTTAPRARYRPSRRSTGLSSPSGIGWRLHGQRWCRRTTASACGAEFAAPEAVVAAG